VSSSFCILINKSVKSVNPLAGISVQDFREGGQLTQEH
jgi:hypothetical protein